MISKESKIPDGWQLTNISCIGKVSGGGTPDTKKAEYWNGDILWATPTDITSLKGKYLTNTKRKISKLGLEKSSAKLLPQNSLLMTSRASIGFCAINKKEITTNQGFQNIIPNSRVDAEFLYYLILSSYFQKQLLSKAYGSTFLEIPNRDVKKIKILLPNSSEQIKIANILSNLDEIIFQTQDIIDQLQLLKKGLMQRLFTESIGHTEFKATKRGKVPENWEKIKLIQILRDEKPLYGIYKKKSFYGTGYKILKIGDVFSKDFYEGEELQKVPLTFEEYTENNIEEEDILIAAASLKKEGIGKNLFVKHLSDKTAFDHNTIRIRVDKRICNPLYLYYYLKSKFVRKQMLSYATKVGTTFLKASAVGKINCYLPSLNEQKKIASILYSKDDQIENEYKFQKKLRIIKRGLMQDLLTGKKRVNIN